MSIENLQIAKVLLLLIGSGVWYIGCSRTLKLKKEGNKESVNQLYMFLGFLLIGAPYINETTKLFNPIDYFTLGSIAFLITAFVYDKQQKRATDKQLNYVVDKILFLSTVSTIFLFLSGFIEIYFKIFNDAALQTSFLQVQLSLFLLSSLDITVAATHMLYFVFYKKKSRKR